MDDEGFFMLSVDYLGDELEFKTRLMASGYTHRFEVFIYDVPVTYEPDEEMNYRAMIDLEKVNSNEGLLTYGLLEAISGQLDALTENQRR